MGQSITIYPVNLLEQGTVTVSGITDTGFPASRLHDRTKAFFWKATATEAKTFHVDQGEVDNLAVNILAVGFNNFSGQDMQWQYSDNDENWTDAVTAWTQAESAAFVKTLSFPLTHRYWQLTLAGMTNPRCSEIFMGPGYEFDIQRTPHPYGAKISNVGWQQTMGGLERSTKFGAARRKRRYSFFLSEAGQAGFDEAMDWLDDFSKPFFLKDHAGEYYWARLSDDPYRDFDHKTHAHFELNLIETV